MDQTWTCSQPPRRMRENMDLNMGVVTEGKESLQQAADRIVREILRVANGKLSAAERAGHREISFTRYGCTF